jgi:hypothetical protein
VEQVEWGRVRGGWIPTVHYVFEWEDVRHRGKDKRTRSQRVPHEGDTISVRITRLRPVRSEIAVVPKRPALDTVRVYRGDSITDSVNVIRGGEP